MGIEPEQDPRRPHLQVEAGEARLDFLGFNIGHTPRSPRARIQDHHQTEPGGDGTSSATAQGSGAPTSDGHTGTRY